MRGPLDFLGRLLAAGKGRCARALRAGREGQVMHSRLIIAGLAAVSTLSVARAQVLKDVVVTANRAERPVAQALADVTTIDASAIARAGSASVHEVLRDLGGVEVAQTGGPGSVSGLFVRGTKNAQTVILVDGVRMENPTSGTGNLEFMPLSAIDRIEVVRGPASVLYGSGAIGGVVQIFTREGKGPPRPFASLGAGSQGTTRAHGGVAGTLGPDGATRFSVALGAERTAGFEGTRPYSPYWQEDRDGNWQRNVTASLRQRFAPGWEAGATLFATTGRVRYDDAFSTPATAKMTYGTNAVTAFVQGRPAAGWQTELRAGQTRIDYAFDAFTFAPRTQSRSLAWVNTIAAGPGSVMLGIEQLHQRIDGEGVTTGDFAYVRDARTTDSVFAGYELELGAHLLRAQVRRDRIQTVGTEPTGALAWGWRLAPGWLARASAASAFRAPTFDDLYNPFGSNPSLKPERSRSVEAAIEHRDGPRLAKATAFASRIHDAIELDSTFTPRNLDSARVTGVSFEARERIGEFTLRGNATLQDPRGERFDPATGAVTTGQLSRRARRFGAFAVDWQPGPLRVGAQWVLQGPRVDSDGNRMAGYGVLNFDASVALRDGWDVFARLANAGDKRYETAWGYNMPPRSVFVGLRYQPK